jgi:DNA-binding NarL/FixJ family response regulator
MSMEVGYTTHHPEAVEGNDDPMNSVNAADHRPRLMIADDDPVVQSMLDVSLSAKFDVIGVAGDSDEAVELARESQPDAAIVDVDMPKGGGLSAVRGILAVAPRTAIVVLSGDESDHVVRELIQAGAITYRRKGVAIDVLTESLNDSIKAHAEASFTPA